MNTSHLLDEAITLAKNAGNPDGPVTAAHVIYGLARLSDMNKIYAEALFTEEELASLEKVKQVFKRYDLDVSLIREALPLLIRRKSGLADPAADNLEDLMPMCDDEATLLTALIRSRSGEISALSTGNTLTDIIGTAGEELEIEVETAGAVAAEPERTETEVSKPETAGQETGSSGFNNFRKISDQARRISTRLHAEIIGQDDAIDRLVRNYFISNYAVRESRRSVRAAYFLTGAAGTGKSHIAALAAEEMGVPCLTLDMREYGSKNSYAMLSGMAEEGMRKESEFFSFVRANPVSVVVMNNLEECYPDIFLLLTTILSSGSAYNIGAGSEQSFDGVTFIFTSRLAKSIYSGASEGRLSAIPKQVILESMRAELSEKLQGWPPVLDLCDAIGRYEVIMLENVRAVHLLEAADKSISDILNLTEERYGYTCSYDRNVPLLLMHGAPGINAAKDASEESAQFIRSEFYEIAALSYSNEAVKDISRIRFDVDTEDLPEDIAPLFADDIVSDVLLVCEESDREKFADSGKVRYHYAETAGRAKELLKEEMELVLIDPLFGAREDRRKLALEDSSSVALDLLRELEAMGIRLPVYIYDGSSRLTEIDRRYLLRSGAMDIITADSADGIREAVERAAYETHIDAQSRALRKRGSYVTFSSSQKIDPEDPSLLRVMFYDLKAGAPVYEGGANSPLREAEKPKTRFDDVIGAEDAKSELKFFISYLKDPRKFILSGGKPPKGVLLYGPPGTGKTMLARAMAGESGVAFLQTTATMFMDSLVGGSEKNIRDLFARAKQYAPAVIFIDEIDAIGKQRTGSISSHHTESMLNALLTEMDGFTVDVDNPVFVLAATNYGMHPDPDDPRKLDEALLRRFDNKILVDLPNRDERLRYIKLKLSHTANSTVTEDAMSNIADRTTGQSLAILESILGLAFRNAARGGEALSNSILIDALDEFMYGEEHKWDEAYYKSVAIHEAGHAVMSYLAGETPTFATIVSRGHFGGYMMPPSSEDKPSHSREEYLWKIRISLAGRASEKVFFGEEDSVNTGAGSDLRKATAIALSMLSEHAMIEGRLVSLPSEMILKTPLAGDYLDEVNDILKRELAETERLIEENRDLVERVADALIKNNSLTTEQIEKLLGSK